MTWSAVSKSLASLKSYVAAVAFISSAVLIVSAVSKVPTKLEAHAVATDIQNDSIIAQLRITNDLQRTTNQLLRASLCIQIKSDTPAGCMLRP